jgi:putative ABC transport system permease protein
MDETWHVDVTEGAVDTLRCLSGTERALVVARIDRVVAEGLPVGVRGEIDGVQTVAVHVGGRVLFCVEDVENRRIVVVAIRELEELARPGIGTIAVRSVNRLRGRSRGGVMSSLLQDLGFAVRSLRRSPGFAMAAVLTLALGIGATAAIFSVANGVLLRPLPWAEPGEVVTLWTSWDNFPDKTWVSIPEYQLFHQENRTLEDLALYGTTSTTFTSVDSPERVGAAFVTPNVFEVLGVSPVIGRVFTWEEAQQPDAGVLLSWEVWQRRHGGDRGITDRTVELNGSPVPVLGVLPEGFALPADYSAPSASAVFYPLYVDLESPAPDLGGGGSHGYYGVARMRDGVTLEDARADLDRVMAGVEPVGLYSAERRFAPRLFAAKADIVGSARATILILLGAVGFVLLIACGNVANLLLSRSEVRRGEVAVRTALGAGRARILRQLLTENLVLAGAAGVIGYGFAFAGVRLLLAIDPNAVPRAGSVSLDVPVILFTLAISLFTVLLFGAVPAFRTSRAGLSASLRQAGRAGRSATGSSRIQGLLVASQLAMAVILLTGSGLLIRTFVSLLQVDPGFQAGNALTLRITAPSGSYPDAASIDRFYSELLRRIREIPGVRTAGAVRLLPLASTMGDSFFRPVDYVPGPNESTQGDWQWATPGYLETMGIPVLEGRAFDERDARGNAAVVLINEVVARKYWGNESPLGHRVLAGGAPDTAVVVGVVGNVAHDGITAASKTRYYVPHAQVNDNFAGSMRSMTLTVATEGPPRRYLDAIRGEIRTANPSVAISEVSTLEEVLSASVAQPRFAMVLLGVFAAVALALAIVGIYGVLAYGVSQRTREIGVRMALGARTGQVVGLVVRQGMLMAIAGVTTGVILALVLSSFLSGLLYGVSPQDPVTYLSVALAFSVVALVACWIPAARAARIRPANALRYE